MEETFINSEHVPLVDSLSHSVNVSAKQKKLDFDSKIEILPKWLLALLIGKNKLKFLQF